MGLLSWIIVGAIAGFLAEQVTKGQQSWVMNIVVGIVGALIGGFLSSQLLGIDVTGINITSILIAFVGALILVFVLRAVAPGRTRL